MTIPPHFKQVSLSSFLPRALSHVHASFTLAGPLLWKNLPCPLHPSKSCPSLVPKPFFSVYQSMLMVLLAVSPSPGTRVSISVFLDIYLIQVYLNQLPEVDHKLIKEKDMVFISLCPQSTHQPWSESLRYQLSDWLWPRSQMRITGG